MDTLAVRFIIAAVAYFLLGALIDSLVTDGQPNRVFKICLLVLCICFAVFEEVVS